MNRQRMWLVLSAWVLATFVGCGGCNEPTRQSPTAAPVKQEPEMEVVASLEPAPHRRDNRLMELAGPMDWGNRYLPAVIVTALSGEEEMMVCSGAAISPQVVLTAGHCVCPKRQQDPASHGSQVVIDASSCFEAARVETVFYEPETEEGATLSPSRETLHLGRVQPHPELRVLLDEHGRVSSSRADLALIFLSKPLGFPGLPLADDDVRVGEPVTIAGYEYDEVMDGFGRERRASTNIVTRLMTAEDERVLVQQPEGHRYRQDSGGPCLRQGAKGPMLVGISSRWLGEGAAFTSTHRYRGWLRDAILRAKTAAASPR